jgi:hypothetical protein
MTDRPGPTGDFPFGKLSEDDKGGLNVALSHFTAPDGTRIVRMDFGYPVDWIALPRDQALAFAALIFHHAGGPDE